MSRNSTTFNGTRGGISKITLAGLLAAAGVLLSGIYFPFGPTRCFPFQHTINVISGIILGPWWALGVAFTTSTIRVITGTGTLFAFPGSIPGAVMVGLTFRSTGKDWAALSEPLGTGPIGATISALILGPAMGKATGIMTLQAAFLASSIPGTILGLLFIMTIRRTGILR